MQAHPQLKEPRAGGTKRSPAFARITIQITPRQVAFLEESADRLEVGISEAVRRVLDIVIQDPEAKKKLLGCGRARRAAAA